jgi:hypothetical protein
MHISEALDMSNIYKHCVRRNRRVQGRNNVYCILPTAAYIIPYLPINDSYSLHENV